MSQVVKAEAMALVINVLFPALGNPWKQTKDCKQPIFFPSIVKIIFSSGGV
jgi:hypothetical protein